MARLLFRTATFLAAATALLGLSCPKTAQLSPPHASAIPSPKLPSSAPIASASAQVLAPAIALAKPIPPEMILGQITADPVETAPDAPVETSTDDDPDDPTDPARTIALPKDETDETGPKLAAIAKEAWIFAKPNWQAKKIGYLRAGSLVSRASKSAGNTGCDQGWYRIKPRGYVCVGKAASLDEHHPVVEAASKEPDRGQGLPYVYAMSKYPPPPFYLKLPSAEDQVKIEQDLEKHKKTTSQREGFEQFEAAIPSSLLYERTVPSLKGPQHAPGSLYAGRPVARSGFALLNVFEWTERLFGMTTDLAVIPLDRTRMVKPSSFKGIVIRGEGVGLPAAFVRAKSEHKYRLDPDQKIVQDAGPIAYREGFALTGRRVRVGGQSYLETRDGFYIQDSSSTIVIPPAQNVPGWAQNGRKWVDISILHQTLVAYEGTRPVFATLVSTGADGLGDPKKTHSTVRGVFLIHTKHVTATMDGDEVGDEFDLRDVPYVQYFSEGYALHGAYWHDEFGRPRSHGCINLSPTDAAWLFAWSDPEVPAHWHAALQTHGGAIVYTHP